MDSDNEHDKGDEAGASEDLFRDLFFKLTRDTRRYVPAAILPAGLSIVAASIFTRIFDPLNYGRYALAIAATTIVGSLLSGWIQQSVLRYLPKFKAEQELQEFVSKLWVVLASVSVPVLIISFLLYMFIDERLGAYQPFFLPAIVLIVTELLFANFNSVFQADLRSREFSLWKISNAVMRLSLALVFVLLIKRDVVGLIVGAAAANFLLVIPMMKGLHIWRDVGSLFRLIDFGFFRMFAAYGLPMIGWLLCGQILGISDRFIIGAFRGSSEVGIYSANYNLVRMGFGLISGPILTACYPLIITAWEKGDKERAPAIISEFSRYYLLAIFPLITFIGIFSKEIVSIILGAEFREGYTIIPFVLAGISLWGLTMIGHKGLEILERTKTMLLLVSVSACMNVFLNLIVVPKYGYNGAAVTTFLSYLVYPVLAYRTTKSTIPWRLPWASIGRVISASIMMGATLVVLRYVLLERAPLIVVLIAAGAIGILVYSASLVLFKELKKYEVRLFTVR